MIDNSDGLNVVRYDTKENWDLYNPILEKGELAVEVNNILNLMKCGDGKTPWSSLKYIYPSYSYNQFSQIGLSKDKVTIELLAKTLPVNSEIAVYVSVSSSSGDYTPLLDIPTNGLLIVRKHATMNVPIIFQLFSLTSPYIIYNARYSEVANPSGFSGWSFNDSIIEQNFVSSPTGNRCSYEVYNSGKVLMYGYISVSANATYVDITPPVTLSKVLLVIPSDAIWATRTEIVTPRKLQWNVGSDNTGLINGKIRIILGETSTGVDSICYYAIGLK